MKPSNRKKIVYLGAFRFPEGDAGAPRVLGIGKALRDCGYEVVFAGGEERGRPEDRLPDGSFSYQGFTYYSTGSLRNRPLPLLQKSLHYVNYGNETLDWLNSLSSENLAAVVAYHGTTAFLVRLRRWCRVKGIPLIVDCTEWYDPAQMAGGRLGISHWDAELRLRWMNARIGNVIVISRFLESYYLGKGCRVLRVPPLVDLQEEKWQIHPFRSSNEKELRLLYAGSPGKKDFIGNILAALESLCRAKHPVVLDLVGPTREEIVNILGPRAKCLDVIGEAIQFHGRVPMSSVPGFLAHANFTVLLRPMAKYANAGFSTKVVESLAAGVPVITNRTGDIGEYIRDNIEGIIVPDESPESLVHEIERLLSMPLEQWNNMRQFAVNRARQSFDYRSYHDACCDYFNHIISVHESLLQ